MRSAILSSALVLALAACGSNEPAVTATDEGMADAMATPGAMPDAMMDTSTPQGFVGTVAASDRYEIEAAQLAQTMAQDAKVKAFAQEMVQDHTKSTANLKDAAAQANPPVMVDPQLTAQQQSDLDALRNAGANFDSVYMQQQVAAHDKALSTLRGYAATGDSPPLKTFAENTATVVSGHLERARSINP